MTGKSLFDFEKGKPTKSFNFLAKFADGKMKKALAIIALLGIATVGLTYAGAININSGTNGVVTFGQGVAQTMSCDSQVTITPASRYDTSSSRFVFDQLTISDIANACQNKRIQLNFYKENGDLINTNGPIQVDYKTDDGNYFQLASNSDYSHLYQSNIFTDANGIGELGSTSEYGSSSFILNQLYDGNGDAIPSGDVHRVTIETIDLGLSAPTSTPTPTTSPTPPPPSNPVATVNVAAVLQPASGSYTHFYYDYTDSSGTSHSSLEGTVGTQLQLNMRSGSGNLRLYLPSRAYDAGSGSSTYYSLSGAPGSFVGGAMLTGTGWSDPHYGYEYFEMVDYSITSDTTVSVDRRPYMKSLTWSPVRYLWVQTNPVLFIVAGVQTSSSNVAYDWQSDELASWKFYINGSLAGTYDSSNMGYGNSWYIDYGGAAANENNFWTRSGLTVQTGDTISLTATLGGVTLSTGDYTIPAGALKRTVTK